MSTPAEAIDSLPPEWREHYAALAATWVREHGSLPPTLEVLARWDSAVSSDEEIEHLQGNAPDPCSKSD